MAPSPEGLRVDQLADHPELFRQVGILRWKEWAYGQDDPARFIEVSDAERAGRTPWILGMVVAREARMLGIGRRLLEGVQDAAGTLGHRQSWVATSEEAAGFYQKCGWEPVEQLRLESTGIPTTILVKPTTV